LAALAQMAVVRRQLHRLGNGRQPKLNASALFSLIRDQVISTMLTRRYVSWSKSLQAT
jgi:hypothetical protein